MSSWGMYIRTHNILEAYPNILAELVALRHVVVLDTVLQFVAILAEHYWQAAEGIAQWFKTVRCVAG